MTRALAPAQLDRRRTGLPRVFLVWLVVFYSIWLAIVAIGGYWSVVADHWVIAVAMAAGSYFAGSTPMGGGTVGFPVIVLLLDQPASIGRDFSFAVQSIGMVSASIYIIASRRPIEWNMLRSSMIGVTLGVPIGAVAVVPIMSDLTVKLTFAVLWASFGVMHFARLRTITAMTGMTPASRQFDFMAGLLVGLAGGATVAAVTGVGVDMLLYVVLVLISRADLKIAIPTSVILMAYTSLIGVATSASLGRFDVEVFHNWLAAAPIVALGAPLGAIIVQLVSRKLTLLVVSVLCVIQFVWTCAHEGVGTVGVGISIGAILLLNLVFHVLYEWGIARSRRSMPSEREHNAPQTGT